LECRHEHKTTVLPVTSDKGIPKATLTMLELVLKARATSNSIALWPKASQDPWVKFTSKWLQIASDGLLSFTESTISKLTIKENHSKDGTIWYEFFLLLFQEVPQLFS